MNMTPKEIVSELDKYIVGQNDAKRAVAVALRNRYRRSCLSAAEKEEITPKNIIMKGPTGVGKTEIARRLAKLVRAPFVKVEASKFTEVGYVGKDVESMVRDLVEMAVRLVHDEKARGVETLARESAEKALVKAIVQKRKAEKQEYPEEMLKSEILSDLRAGKLDKEEVDIEVAVRSNPIEMVEGSGAMIDIGALLPFGRDNKKKRKVKVKEAFEYLLSDEIEKRLDMDAVKQEAVVRAEQEGIIFIDEIDKIASKGSPHGPDVSREGVQRDILPIVEGSTVNTKYGAIKTDYILFIASGAFHVSKVEELIPELQGRFPIRVELASLKREDFIRILKEPQNAIIKQYAGLLRVDNINLIITDGAINLLEGIAEDENGTAESIGARRLHTVMEHLLAEISFDASGDYPMTDLTIDEAYVETRFASRTKNHDLKKYIL
ncbi:MAG: ATP-dependent protease ATPase subunit HslU [Firmicutes bacterium]|nr:ATP-dependent protease ATPase subunit HslU [Bacillota bacterium]